MKLKLILFNVSIIIFIVLLIYLYIYINYKYEGFQSDIYGLNINELKGKSREEIAKIMKSKGLNYDIQSGNVYNDNDTSCIFGTEAERARESCSRFKIDFDPVKNEAAIKKISTDSVPVLDDTINANALEDASSISKLTPTLSDIEKDGSSEDKAILSTLIPKNNLRRSFARDNRGNPSPLPELRDGYYWVNFGTETNKINRYIYCIMDRSYYGGGWMIAMRGVRGSRTFGFTSSYWTNNNTYKNNKGDIDNAINTGNIRNELAISSIGNTIFTNFGGLWEYRGANGWAFEPLNQGGIDKFDAKFDTFNIYPAREWMAIFYFRSPLTGEIYKGGDQLIGEGNGLFLSNRDAKGWIWYEKNVNIRVNNVLTAISPLQLFQHLDNPSGSIRRKVDLRANYGVGNAKQLQKFGNKPAGYERYQLWSSQHGYNFYGINYDEPEFAESWWWRGSSTRWGFAWNENWNYADNTWSNDVYNGIGLRHPGITYWWNRKTQGTPGWSCGDFIYCCQDANGVVNQSIAFEWYVR